jgi:hypothetical protein
MCVVWNDILQNINRINIALQQPGIHVGSIEKHYSAISKYLMDLRNESEFNKFEAKAKELVSHAEYSDGRARKRKRLFGETDNEVMLMGKDGMWVTAYLPIIDKLIAEMTKRQSAYSKASELYGFLFNSDKSADMLVQLHQSDVESDLIDEWRLFQHYLNEVVLRNDPQAIMNYIIEHKISNSFPNLFVCLRIYLCILATNCEGERSFSTLSRVKNFMRSTMGQEKLVNLSLLTIESDLACKSDFSRIIQLFADKKSRKVKTLTFK